MIGPVSITAAASDREAVCYEGEIANVLEDTGFKVEIDNAKANPSAQQVPTGIEMTVKEETVRPIHAYRIVRAFRSAGVAIATRINGKQRKNNTLYITVGPNAAPGLVPLTTGTAAKWKLKVRRTLLEKWKMKFASGPRGPGQPD
jgi:translation initiation factor IF-1